MKRTDVEISIFVSATSFGDTAAAAVAANTFAGFCDITEVARHARLDHSLVVVKTEEKMTRPRNIAGKAVDMTNTSTVSRMSLCLR